MEADHPATHHGRLFADSLLSKPQPRVNEPLFLRLLIHARLALRNNDHFADHSQIVVKKTMVIVGPGLRESGAEARRVIC